MADMADKLKINNNDMITLLDYSTDEIRTILKFAHKMKIG